MQTIQFKSNSVNYKVEEPFILESGHALQDLRIQYTTYGELNSDKSNVVWVFHALTANSHPDEWWPELIGEGHFVDPNKHFIVCANLIGSCYGSTEPASFDFPLITIRDMVNGFKLLKNKLEIEKIQIGIGGSMGGQTMLQWTVDEPDLFETIVPIATNAVHSAWGIAFNESQRMALKNDDLEKGLEAARAIALLSYRGYETYQLTQTDLDNRSDNFSASSYQQYQGQKLFKRFSPYSYYTLSKAMDSHNVGIGYDSIGEALKRIKSFALVIGIESDILFPPSEQKFITSNIPNAIFKSIESKYGHDGFLIETEQIEKLLFQHLT